MKGASARAAGTSKRARRETRTFDAITNHGERKRKRNEWGWGSISKSKARGGEPHDSDASRILDIRPIETGSCGEKVPTVRYGTGYRAVHVARTYPGGRMCCLV